MFAYGVTNMEQDPKEFKFEILFKEARDSMNNPLEGLDEDTVLSWFDNNDFEIGEIDTYGQAFIPVGVTVGEEMGPGVDTAPANYVFEIRTSYNLGHRYEQYDLREFTFRVK